MDILTAGIIQESRKHQTALAIHKYALAHAGTAALLAQTELGDEACLTILTAGMLYTIVAINGGKWSTKFLGAVLAIAGGEVIGIKTGMLLLKWMPLIGNAANAGASFFTTELLGWTAYALLSSGCSPENLQEREKADILKLARKLKSEEDASGSGRELYRKMSKADKKAVDDLMKCMRKTKSQEAAEEFAAKLGSIFMNYA